MNDISDRRNRPDLDAFWMPFTANRQFKADPRLLVAAKGMYYRTEDGREVHRRHVGPVVRQRRPRARRRSPRRSASSC